MVHPLSNPVKLDFYNLTPIESNPTLSNIYLDGDYAEAVRNIVFMFVVIAFLAIRSCYSVYYQTKESSKSKINLTSSSDDEHVLEDDVFGVEHEFKTSTKVNLLT